MASRETDDSIAAGTAAPRTRLRQRFLESGAWTTVGFGSRLVLRLGGNVVLTRMLFPEVFGLMALVRAFNDGLAMFSDMGISTSIVRDKRGEDPGFLRTAWTMQICRGFALCLCSTLIAWPVSKIYGESSLAYLLPAAALGTVAAGFMSTAVPVHQRHMRLAIPTLIDLGSSVLGLAITIGLASYFRSVWALVSGSVAGYVIHAAASHFLLRGISHRLEWNPRYARDLFHFGKWILLSTGLGFIASQGDRLIVGVFSTLSELGVYSIAFFLANAASLLIARITAMSLFPLFSRMITDAHPEAQQEVRRARALLLFIACLAVLFMVTLGQFVVDLLYDDRYSDAGWMVQVLSIGVFASVANNTLAAYILAAGKSYEHMIIQAAKSLALVACMIVGGGYAGIQGLVVGAAVAPYTAYPVTAYYSAKEGSWDPALDFGCFAALGGILFGWWVLVG